MKLRCSGIHSLHLFAALCPHPLTFGLRVNLTLSCDSCLCVLDPFQRPILNQFINTVTFLSLENSNDNKIPGNKKYIPSLMLHHLSISYCLLLPRSSVPRPDLLFLVSLFLPALRSLFSRSLVFHQTLSFSVGPGPPLTLSVLLFPSTPMCFLH